MNRVWPTILGLALAVAPPALPDGPAPRLVADLSQTNLPEPMAPPVAFVEMNGIGYFFAADGMHGIELWRSDLTAPGTWLVKDICPGDCWGGWGAFAGLPVVLNETLYFVADDGTRGRNLWRSDGTASGTWMVADLAPGRQRGACGEGLTALDTFVLFAANDGVHGCELWRSDGTAEGTFLVADTNPGDDGDGPTAIRQLTGDTALFGSEASLWVTDGTRANTSVLAAVEVVDTDSGVFQGRESKVFGGIYYFLGDDGTSGPEVWASDGTPGGTMRLVDGVPGSGGITVTTFEELADWVYFTAGDFPNESIWRTQGTTASTEPFFGPAAGGDEITPNLLRVTGGRLYFAADDPVIGKELWASDGTAGGTGLVLDIGSAGDGLAWSHPDRTAELGGGLIFWPDDGIHGQEPWHSDGSLPGTGLLRDIYDGEGWSLPIDQLTSIPRRVGDRIASFALELDSEGYWNPWTTDGTPSGTQRVTRIDEQTSAFVGFLGLRTAAFGIVDEGALLVALVEGEPTLYRSDGTPSGTEVVDPFDEGEAPSRWSLQPLPTIDGRVLFQTQRDTGSDGALWSSDGLPGGSIELAEGNPSFEVLTFADSVIAKHGDFVYQSDGTLEGTRVLTGLDSVQEVAFEGDRGLLSAHSTAGESEPWFLSSLDAEPELVLDVNPSGSSSPSSLGAAQSGGEFLALFFADDGSGRQLWRTNGNAAGTEKIANLSECDSPPRPDTQSGDARSMVWYGGLFYFCADDGVSGPEPWTSDGTPEGTLLLLDLEPGPQGSEPAAFVATGAGVIFAAQTTTSGRELWHSAGTPQLTSLVEDLAPGPESSLPHWLTVHGNSLYFSAYSPDHGVELRAYDLALSGTTPIELLHDLNPGEASSSPIGLTPDGGTLWFAATDGVHGFEPWRIELDALFVDGFESGDLVAWDRVIDD